MINHNGKEDKKGTYIYIYIQIYTAESVRRKQKLT